MFIMYKSLMDMIMPPPLQGRAHVIICGIFDDMCIITDVPPGTVTMAPYAHLKSNKGGMVREVRLQFINLFVCIMCKNG